MEISHSHRFIFVHIYRAGGQSVAAALRPYAYEPRPRLATKPLFRRLPAARIQRLRGHYHGHIKAKELKAELPAKTFDSYFKFTFARNPWAWQVSIYHYIQQRTDHADHEFYKASFPRFEDYLEWRIRDQGPELQTEFVLSDSGEVLVDFIGRHETLAADFATVCARIGIDARLPHINRSAHGDFQDYYTPGTRALVAEAYRDDIDFFGYEFEEQTAYPPIPSAH